MNLILSTKNMIELKAKLKNKYPQLTEADLFHSVGKEQDMLRMVEYKLRKTKDEMKDIISNLYTIFP